MSFKDEFDLITKQVLIEAGTDQILRAFKLLADEINADYSMENEELAKREKLGIWRNEQRKWMKGTHPYTEQQLREYLASIGQTHFQ
jgi:hypothetical protein